MSMGCQQSSIRPITRASRLVWLLVGAAVLAASAHAAGGGASQARLVGVSLRAEGGTTAVVIETTSPVAYLTSQPDSRTLLVDLRNVAPGSHPALAAPRGVLAHVSVESATAEDGASLARVRLAFATPASPTVRSRWNTVVVELGGRAGMADAGAPGAAVPQTVVAPPSPAPVKAPAKADAAATAVAATLTAIDVVPGPDGFRVRFTGTGQFAPSTVELTKGLPARLVIDFPRTLTKVPAVTPVGKGPIDKIRVAINSRQPLITRAVIDLKYPVGHRVEPTDSGLTILLDPGPGESAEPKAGDSPAPTHTPTVTPTQAAAPAPTVTPTQTAAPAAPPAPRVEAPAAASALQPVATPAPQPVPKAAAPAAGSASASAPAPVPASTPAPTAGQAAPAQAPPADPAAAGSRKYTGHLISLDFQQADLRAVLRSFTEISGLNVIVDPTISGTVDLMLKELPWDQALDYILGANKLGYLVEANVVRIAPLAVLAEEEAARQKLKDARAMSGELKVFTRTLSYAKAEDLAALLPKSALTQRGGVQVDKRTNTIIVSDLPAALEQAARIVESLDRPEPQVEVEARIVQTSRDSARALGVQWGLAGRAVPYLGNTTPVSFPNAVALTGRSGSASKNAEGSPLSTAVDMAVSGATTAVGLAMGSVNGSFNLDVALSALEQKGNARVLSSPRVIMQNNYEAEMTQGIQIPIQTISNNTVTVSFKDAALTLKVRPQITASNTVIMDVKLENASADFSKAINGIPPINTQRAYTQVLVTDNDTIVIGGIVVSQEQTKNDNVPLMSRIPLLGWLFKRDSFSDENRELLIFITPRIRR
ncbi:MAG: type IV pilus secretin PilQ [Acidobacteriota bacterium]